MSGSLGFQSVSDLVKHYESGGNYLATNPTSTASGAYQFTNGTWQQYAQQIGVNTAQFPTASSAPPAVQDAVFTQAVSKNGLGDWTCPGCNTPLTNYVAPNDVSNLPIFSGGSGSSGNTLSQNFAGGTTGTIDTPFTDPMTGFTTGTGTSNYAPSSGQSLLPGVPGAQSVLNWLNGLGSWLGGLVTAGEDFVLRSFLVFVGVVVVGIALWWLMAGENPAKQVSRGAKALVG